MGAASTQFSLCRHVLLRAYLCLLLELLISGATGPAQILNGGFRLDVTTTPACSFRPPCGWIAVSQSCTMAAWPLFLSFLSSRRASSAAAGHAVRFVHLLGRLPLRNQSLLGLLECDQTVAVLLRHEKCS